MSYTKNPIPANLAAWRVAEIEKLRAKFETDAFEKNGVLYWKSNSRPVPTCVFEKDALCTPSAEQIAEDRRVTDEFLAEYRRNYRGPSAEDRAEMRAAFGPGVEVVNVITGSKVRT